MQKAQKNQNKNQKRRFTVWLGRVSLGVACALLFFLFIAMTLYAPPQKTIIYGNGQKLEMDRIVRRYYSSFSGRFFAFTGDQMPLTKAQLLKLPPNAQVAERSSGKHGDNWITRAWGETVGEFETTRLGWHKALKAYHKPIVAMIVSFMLGFISLIWPKKKINENEKYQ